MVISAIDMNAVLVEVEEEARRLRSSGLVAPSFERHLDKIFSMYVPKANADPDLNEAIRASDAASFINVAVPIDTSKRTVSFVKRVLRKLMWWYMDHMAKQVLQFGRLSVRVDRILAARIAALENQAGHTLPIEELGGGILTELPDMSPYRDMLVNLLTSQGGRVLHLGCGRGDLLEALVASGVDAYGVEFDGELADVVASRGLDVWSDEPWEHLGNVGPESLSGLIVSGIVDRSPPGRLWELLGLARDALREGAPIILICTTPIAWSTVASPIQVDLAIGRPLHAETWEKLLSISGFHSIESRFGPAVPGLVELSGGDPVLNANMQLLNDTLFGPSSVACMGVKHS